MDPKELEQPLISNDSDQRTDSNSGNAYDSDASETSLNESFRVVHESEDQKAPQNPNANQSHTEIFLDDDDDLNPQFAQSVTRVARNENGAADELHALLFDTESFLIRASGTPDSWNSPLASTPKKGHAVAGPGGMPLSVNRRAETQFGAGTAAQPPNETTSLTQHSDIHAFDTPLRFPTPSSRKSPSWCHRNRYSILLCIVLALGITGAGLYFRSKFLKETAASPDEGSTVSPDSSFPTTVSSVIQSTWSSMWSTTSGPEVTSHEITSTAVAPSVTTSGVFSTTADVTSTAASTSSNCFRGNC